MEIRGIPGIGRIGVTDTKSPEPSWAKGSREGSNFSRLLPKPLFF